MTLDTLLLHLDIVVFQMIDRVLVDTPAEHQSDVLVLNWRLWQEATRPALEQALKDAAAHLTE